MLPTQNVWLFLSKCDNKIVQWNIGYSILLYIASRGLTLILREN